MADIPNNLKFLDSHEWARLEDDGTVTVGISDPVAAKRDDAVRTLDGMLAVTLGQPRETQLCLVMTGC